MRHLDSLWRAFNALSAARDLTLDTRRFQWQIQLPNTVYIQAEHARIRIAPHERMEVLAKIELQAPFGWQLAAEQDAAGVYIIARRKALIGKIGRGQFDIKMPRGLHLSLKLENCQLCLDDWARQLDIPPGPQELE